jgi:hypothetical protein
MAYFSNDLSVRKLQYQELLIKEGDYTFNEVKDMSLRDLRAAVDEVLCVSITELVVTAAGGVSRRTRKIA